MGVSYSEFDEYVYVVVVVPDGRILAQRTTFRSLSAATPWEASVGRASVDYRDNGTTASLALWTKFEIECSSGSNKLNHLASHYVSSSNRIIDMYILKLQSGTVLRCTRNMEIEPLPLEKLAKEVKRSGRSFSSDTIEAITFLSQIGGVK